MSWERFCGFATALGVVWEECLESMLVEIDDVVEAVTVVAVSSSGLIRVGCSVQTRLCALSKCEAIEVDITSPND